MAHFDITASAQPTPEQAEQVLDLHRRAGERDGVGPLSEDSRLALVGRGPRRRHLLAYAGSDLVGYLGSDGGPEPSAELVVDPDHRHQGVGRALWNQLAEPRARVWGHGRLPAADAFAAALGLEPVRELLKMARPLGPQDVDAADAVLPDGFVARSFVPGPDDVDVEAVNASAFAHHPEQGQMGLSGLRARMAEAWFDPQGLIVVEDGSGEVAAFHWTKIDPPVAAGGTVGEVYVVAVAPAYQGRGLARPLTALGLGHLARQGLATVDLYVDGDNTPARATYARLGFETIMVDVMYSRAVHLSVEA